LDEECFYGILVGFMVSFNRLQESNQQVLFLPFQFVRVADFGIIAVVLIGIGIGVEWDIFQEFKKKY